MTSTTARQQEQAKAALIESLRTARAHVKQPIAPRGADLRGVDLREVDLRGAVLQDVDLQGADLEGADLRYADLRGANLTGVDLSRVNLYGAKLSRVNLRGARLSGANLVDVDMRGADLRDADLGDADLRGADLRGANLRNTDLWGANLEEVNAGILHVTGLHPYPATMIPTVDGWLLRIGCWEGTVQDLRDIIAKDHGWPEARGDQITARRPLLTVLAAMCDVHAAHHKAALDAVMKWWGNEMETTS